MQPAVMEYGIFMPEIGDLPAEPRSICPENLQHLLPSAPLRAVYFGSEFCIDLLPDPATAQRFCSFALERDVEPVLLTPLVTTEGLTLVERLLAALCERGCRPDVVFNDWGVFNLLRNRFPGVRRRAGRLMNRGLRDPRLALSDAPFPGDASGGMQRALLLRMGVEAVETDADLDGTYLGDKVEGVQRVLHFPFVFAASGRNCLVKAEGLLSVEDAFIKGLPLSCAGPCRGCAHKVVRDDTPFPLWRSGNTVFYEAPPQKAEAHLARADRVVLYARATA